VVHYCRSLAGCCCCCDCPFWNSKVCCRRVSSSNNQTLEPQRNMLCYICGRLGFVDDNCNFTVTVVTYRLSHAVSQVRPPFCHFDMHFCEFLTELASCEHIYIWCQHRLRQYLPFWIVLQGIYICAVARVCYTGQVIYICVWRVFVR
jgi:hypothetical protein